MTDPIADMLTRIRNTLAVNKAEVSIPHSNLKATILAELLRLGFVFDVKTVGEMTAKKLVVTLRSDSEPARISSLSRISRPGQRVYSKAGAIPKAKNGRGVVLVSTSKGVVSDSEARKQKLGGELICKIY